MRERKTTIYRRALIVLVLASSVSVALLSARIAVTHSLRYWYLLWNLFLAWLPLLFAIWLSQGLSRWRWRDWHNLVLSFLWLGFLPNSFYIVSDLIHLQSTGETALLYDAAIMTSFIINGLILGYMSLYIVHRQLLKRYRIRKAHGLVAAVLLSCSFAVYLGRYLRWNTWDVLFHPAGLLFDISDRIVNPLLHLDTFLVTGVFFIMLASIYAVIYELAELVKRTV